MSEQRCSACAAFAAVVLLLLPCSAPALEIPEAVREVIDRSAVTLVTGRTTARHSSGSGAVLTDDGLVITSAHVVGCTRSIKLVLAGRKKPLLAYPVAIDDGADLALLQLSFVPPDLSPIELAEEVPPPGAGLWAWGMSSGLRGGWTFEHRHGDLRAMLRARPGDSGGPVLDSGGRLVGVTATTTSINPGSAGDRHMAGVIPIEGLRPLLEQSDRRRIPRAEQCAPERRSWLRVRLASKAAAEGDHDYALSNLDLALRDYGVQGALAAQLLVQRAAVLHRLQRDAEAARALQEAREQAQDEGRSWTELYIRASLGEDLVGGLLDGSLADDSLDDLPGLLLQYLGNRRSLLLRLGAGQHELLDSQDVGSALRCIASPPEDGLEACEDALARDREHWALFHDAARARAASGDSAGAAELLDRVLAEGMVHPSLFFLRGRLHALGGEPDQALAMLDAAEWGFGPAADVFRARASILHRLGRADEAMEAMKRAEELLAVPPGQDSR